MTLAQMVTMTMRQSQFFFYSETVFFFEILVDPCLVILSTLVHCMLDQRHDFNLYGPFFSVNVSSIIQNFHFLFQLLPLLQLYRG